MDLKEIQWGGVDWIHLVQDRDQSINQFIQLSYISIRLCSLNSRFSGAQSNTYKLTMFQFLLLITTKLN
jgi:hypothetical protein